jgi:hypothetical protein
MISSAHICDSLQTALDPRHRAAVDACPSSMCGAGTLVWKARAKQSSKQLAMTISRQQGCIAIQSEM